MVLFLSCSGPEVEHCQHFDGSAELRVVRNDGKLLQTFDGLMPRFNRVLVFGEPGVQTAHFNSNKSQNHSIRQRSDAKFIT